MHCRVCGKESNGDIEYLDVPFPTVVFPDGKILINLNAEREIFYNESTGYPFGVTIDIFTNDKSNYSDTRVNNITEFHYLFDTIRGDEQVALESDLHWHGGTKPLNVIKFISIKKAEKLSEDYYS
mgnify:CR=1 FL=1